MTEPAASPMERDLSGTYLFISFDLVNSTAFKTSTSHWPPLFNSFFDFCQIITRNYFPSCKTWKMIGDEILFYLPVEDAEEIIEAPAKVYSLLRKCMEHLDKECKKKGILSVKATLWSSVVRELRHSKFETSGANYLLKSQQGGELTLDFLGPDIDAGFRIGSYALHGKLVIGAQMACFISTTLQSRKETKELDNFRIVSLKQLRGVWAGRHYPIVWYSEEWKDTEKLFYYDEKFTSPLVAQILQDKICETPNIQKIHKIFNDLSLQHTVTLLTKGIKQYTQHNWGKELNTTVPTERLSELHLVAFCFNEKSELLIGFNEKDRVWDFGLGYLMNSKSIEESLITAYENDFGITLQEIEDEFPPVATYSVVSDNWEQKTIPGIMCLADISNQELSVDPFRYKKTQFITEKSASKIKASDAVEGFHERVTMAFQTFKNRTCRCSE